MSASQKKILIFFENLRFEFTIQADLLSGKNTFSLISFYSECKNIKENFISFRNMFLKNKKRVN